MLPRSAVNPHSILDAVRHPPQPASSAISGRYPLKVPQMDKLVARFFLIEKTARAIPATAISRDVM